MWRSAPGSTCNSRQPTPAWHGALNKDTAAKGLLGWCEALKKKQGSEPNEKALGECVAIINGQHSRGTLSNSSLVPAHMWTVKERAFLTATWAMIQQTCNGAPSPLAHPVGLAVPSVDTAAPTEDCLWPVLKWSKYFFNQIQIEEKNS